LGSYYVEKEHYNEAIPYFKAAELAYQVKNHEMEALFALRQLANCY